MFEEIADRLERSRAAWIIAAIFIFQCLIFIPVATVRPIDGDEGFYLLAAKLVFEGKQLYTDFFYPQMPLLPYVYGLWMKLFGFSWYAARILSALLAVGTGLLLYSYAMRLTSKRHLGLLAVGLYALCSVMLGWYTVAKTYSLSVFLLMSAVVLLPRDSDSHRELRYVLSGLLLGLAIDTRLFFLAVVPVFLLVLRHRKESKPVAQLKSQRWLLLGVVIGLLPNLWFLVVSPDTYIFNNIGYHAMRTGGGLLGFLEQKLLIVLELIGAWKAWGHVSLQLPILLFANCYYLLLAWRLGKRLSFVFYIAAVLSVISLLPTPTFVQYFCVVIPFLIVNAILVIHWLDDAVPGGTARASLGLLGVLIVVAYVLVAPVGVEQFLAPPPPDPLTGEGGGEWDIETNRIIAAQI
ncbi:MAG: glycosyltransferase family 39 protein, partial [Armatimonadetes bacterium]|nr:glycosyltransferase family 39 protein [Armatimonadota bacterium]